MHDLATVETKFIHLGMSLDDAIAKVTAVPAETILMSDKIGTLSLGAWGDAVIFEFRDRKSTRLTPVTSLSRMPPSA